MSATSALALPGGVDALAAVCCAGAAGWVATAGSGAARRVGGLQRPGRSGALAGGGTRTGGLFRSRPGVVPDPALALAAAVAAWLVAGPAAGVVTAAAGALLLRRRASASRGRAAEAERRARVALCEAVAAELRAGRPPAAALSTASANGHGTAAVVVRRAAGVAALGGDVAGALRAGADAAPPGVAPDVLLQLAACWAVAERSGAGLAPAVRRLAEGLRAQERHRGELAGELAGAQVTARLLAVLPGLGLLLAAAIGAQPLVFLLETPLGVVCLLAALALDLAGLAWTRRLTEVALAGRATRSGDGP